MRSWCRSLHHRFLPPRVDGPIFGGGPELYAQALSENTAMRGSAGFCKQGNFVWAECGGLMYLARPSVHCQMRIRIRRGHVRGQCAGCSDFGGNDAS